jgi:hypothetical protein
MDGNSYEALTRPLKGRVSERLEVRVERRRRWSVEQIGRTLANVARP